MTTNTMTTTTGAPYALGIGRSRALVACATLAEASALYARLRDASGLGGSKWPDGRIYDVSGERPRQLAHVSYNAKIWKGTRYDAAATPIYNPYAADAVGGAR